MSRCYPRSVLALLCLATGACQGSVLQGTSEAEGGGSGGKRAPDATVPIESGGSVDHTSPDAQVGDAAVQEVVDADEYHGDGSYFAEAKPALDAPSSRDGSLGDSSSDGPSRDGSSDGVTVLVSGLDETPLVLASDGVTLFWTTSRTSRLLSVPVDGGAVSILTGAVGVGDIGYPDALAVDAENVYTVEKDVLVRIPKDGSPAQRISEPGAPIAALTIRASVAYWAESQPLGSFGSSTMTVTVKSSPLHGGAISVIGSWSVSGVGSYFPLGATSSEIILGNAPLFAYEFNRAQRSDSGLTSYSSSTECASMTSDTDAVYCAGDGSGLVPLNERLGSDGTITKLGLASNSSPMVFDDTYVYWANDVADGTIMRSPKVSGGNGTVLAHATNPFAVAVDDHSVYWSDTAGNIKRLAK